MTRVEQILQLFDSCTEAERLEVLRLLRDKHPIHPLEEQLNCTAEIILEAISRASDLSLRGVRGLIAEAFFEINILPKLVRWSKLPIIGDAPYDFLLKDASGSVSIQV